MAGISISDEEVQEIKKAFDSYDSDKSGTIEMNELNHLAIDLGQEFDDEELAEAFQALDSDGSGKIEFDEFLRWWIG